MNTLTLAIKEACYRKTGFLIILFSLMIAVAVVAGSITVLRIHDIRSHAILTEKREQTEATMAELKDEMRVAMLKLGLNLVILPAGQDIADWYLEDGADAFMPENYVEKLADSGVVTVRHFLPNLQQEIKWPERNRRIILIGTKGEVPNLHKKKKDPIVQPVPADTIVLGWELHRSLALENGDRIKLMGKEFKVDRCHEERGNKDDITAWISLKDAQDLLNKEGLINSILALECVCKGPDFSTVRHDITEVLPDTKVLEVGTERRLARAEARMSVARRAGETLEKERLHRAQVRSEKELLAAILVGVALTGSSVWIGFLTMSNVRQRMNEIGILQSVGFHGNSILRLFLYKALFVACVGALLGLVLGLFAASCFGMAGGKIQLENMGFWQLISMELLLTVFVAAPLLTTISSALPAIIAIRQDPASILRKEAA